MSFPSGHACFLTMTESDARNGEYWESILENIVRVCDSLRQSNTTVNFRRIDKASEPSQRECRYDVYCRHTHDFCSPTYSGTKSRFGLFFKDPGLVALHASSAYRVRRAQDQEHPRKQCVMALVEPRIRCLIADTREALRKLTQRGRTDRSCTTCAQHVPA
jgi:hypothetical protein